MIKFKQLIKSFTPYQTFYLAAVVTLVAVSLIFFPDITLGEYQEHRVLILAAVVSTIANPLCELLISKQSKVNFLVDIFLIEVPELIISISLGWYALCATIVLFWLPVDIVSYLRWNRHPDQDDQILTKVKSLKPWQSALTVVAILVFGLVVGSLLRLIPGASDTYLDAFSSALGMANGILLLLRYSEQWLAWLLTTIAYLFMDISSGLYILIITQVAMLVNTIYGMFKWWAYTKRHPDNT